jgi:cytoskeletal protein CcmA (bactofilin family)
MQVTESLVDRDSHFDGLYRTKQNLRVEGMAEGQIECEGTLTVVEGARVKATVTANDVTVAGELAGEVTCRNTFSIEPTGQVEATVTARRLVVQEGGFYNGEFRMAEEEPVSSYERPSRREVLSDDWLSQFSSEDAVPPEPTAESEDGLELDEEPE